MRRLRLPAFPSFPAIATGNVVRTFGPSAVRLTGAGIQFINTILIARLLGEAEAAPFFFWSAILMSWAPIATYGLEQLALRHTPRLKSDGPDVVGAFLAPLRMMSILAAALIGFGLIGYAVLQDLSAGGFQTWHLLMPIAVASMALCSINGEALKGLSHPTWGMVYGHFIPVSTFLLCICLLWSKASSPILLTAYTGSYLLAVLLARFGPVSEFRRPHFAIPPREKITQILKDGLPVCSVNLFGALSFVIPLAILEHTRSPGEVTHVIAAFRISILFGIVSTAIHGVFAPNLAEAADQPNPLRPVMGIYLKSVWITLGVLLIPLLIGVAYPGEIMQIFGPGFDDASTTLILLLLIQVASLTLGPVLLLLLMAGHTRTMAWLGFCKLLVAASLALVLVPKWGGPGMVVTMAIAFLGEEIFGMGIVIRRMWKTSRAESRG